MQKMEPHHGLPCLRWQHALAVRILILNVLCLKVSLKCLLCVCPINLEMMKWFSLKLWSASGKKILWLETIYIHLNEQSCSFQKRTHFPTRLETQIQQLQDKRLKIWSGPETERPTGPEKGTNSNKGDCTDLFFFFFNFTIFDHFVKVKLLETSPCKKVNFSLKRWVSGLCRISLENTIRTYLTTWEKVGTPSFLDPGLSTLQCFSTDVVNSSRLGRKGLWEDFSGLGACSHYFSFSLVTHGKTFFIVHALATRERTQGRLTVTKRRGVLLLKAQKLGRDSFSKERDLLWTLLGKEVRASDGAW